MSDDKHSPLPWKVEQYYSSRAVGIVAADNRRIVRSSWNENSPYYPTQAQTYANFYLIASAVNSAAAKDARIAELEADNARLRAEPVITPDMMPYEKEALSLMTKLGVLVSRPHLGMVLAYFKMMRDAERDEMGHDALVRLVELTASYCHKSAEYWNDKDANVLIEMARRMAPCTEAAGANLYNLRSAALATKGGVSNG